MRRAEDRIDKIDKIDGTTDVPIAPTAGELLGSSVPIARWFGESVDGPAFHARGGARRISRKRWNAWRMLDSVTLTDP